MPVTAPRPDDVRPPDPAQRPPFAENPAPVATLVDERQVAPPGNFDGARPDHDAAAGALDSRERVQHLPADAQPSAGCTAPQLRRFIKSRPYVPMHELRRRFGIDGGDDDVVPVDVSGGKVYVGLPPREGALLGDLLRGGEIGFELSLDPRSPVVVGLYPMRPVART
ncbi:MAG TPA: hypothetical protein VFP22_06775 [Candidatus Limnocylindrales bacterium]|nr:hypothetical protein [Candidatus Limnocylindrales bacterium]